MGQAMSDLGVVIRDFRVARKLDIGEVARRIGAPLVDVRGWERGEDVPSTHHWARLKGQVARDLSRYSSTFHRAVEEARMSGLKVPIDIPSAPYIPSADSVAAVTETAESAPLPEDADSIGEAIKRARFIEGLSQDELGAIIGATGQAVSSWEVGRMHPIRLHVERLIELIPALSKWSGTGQDIDKPVSENAGRPPGEQEPKTPCPDPSLPVRSDVQIVAFTERNDIITETLDPVDELRSIGSQYGEAQLASALALRAIGAAKDALKRAEESYVDATSKVSEIAERMKNIIDRIKETA